MIKVETEGNSAPKKSFHHLVRFSVLVSVQIPYHGSTMCLFFLGLFLLLPQQLDLPVFVDRVSETYGKLNSLSADFEQMLNNGRLRSQGHVSLKVGRKALFQYSTPQQMMEYFDGKTYTRYVPAMGQAETARINQADNDLLAIFLLLGNPGSQWKDQFVSTGIPRDAPATAGNRLVLLIPRNKNFLEVLVEVNPRTFLIHRFVVIRADGERNEFVFRNIDTARLDDSLFNFKAPAGVKIVESR